MNIWQILGIEPTKDVAAIKRCYAARSREVHPEDSPEEFRLLYESYLAALDYARQTELEGSESSFSPDLVIEAPEEKPSGYMDLVSSAEREGTWAENAVVESVLARLEELIAARGSADDFIAALGTPVTLGTRQTRVCFLSAFAAALTDFIKAHKKLPNALYEAVVLVYEFSYRLAPSPAKDLQPLYNVLRDRKRLTTRKERRIKKWGTVFLFATLFFLLCLGLGGSSMSNAGFLVVIGLSIASAVGIIVTSAKERDFRVVSPYSEELQKLRQRRSLQ